MLDDVHEVVGEGFGWTGRDLVLCTTTRRTEGETWSLPKMLSDDLENYVAGGAFRDRATIPICSVFPLLFHHPYATRKPARKQGGKSALTIMLDSCGAGVQSYFWTHM